MLKVDPSRHQEASKEDTKHNLYIITAHRESYIITVHLTSPLQNELTAICVYWSEECVLFILVARIVRK